MENSRIAFRSQPNRAIRMRAARDLVVRAAEIATVVAILAAQSATAQTPCDWTTATGKIYETCGSVGIGTTTPALTLDVVGANTVRAVRNTAPPWLGGLPQAGMTLKHVFTGIGSQMPSDFSIAFIFQLEDSDSSQIVGRVGAVKDGGVSANGNPYGKLVFTIFAPNPPPTGAPAEVSRFEITNSGVRAVGVPLETTYADIAEWVSVRGAREPGTVVVIHEAGTNEVSPSQHAYDTGVAGVISGKPGIVLGEAGEERATVATMGRVKVKVDATKAPIHTGNLLVTSDREGYAMRSEPIEVAGVKMHRPGTLIGKALEPLETGQGEILILLGLQ